MREGLRRLRRGREGMERRACLKMRGETGEVLLLLLLRVRMEVGGWRLAAGQ